MSTKNGTQKSFIISILLKYYRKMVIDSFMKKD